jgi:hypothetical protein
MNMKNVLQQYYIKEFFMKTVIKIAFMLVVFQFNLMPDSVSAEEMYKRESCRVCGMYIDRYAWKNQDRGINVNNTGGTALNLAFVSDYRFLNALGGNFKLRGSVGLPIYEDLNSNKMKSPRGAFQQVQLGDGFFANVALV